ncbi:hypothetical protein LCGC14_2584210 [marine sediment metagenome]|uniref:Uncharacterized protein n=1 Tax=marine sediment metagenome TaxID=412755 RepID=A0A0F8XHM9_9ZZZZ
MKYKAGPNQTIHNKTPISWAVKGFILHPLNSIDCNNSQVAVSARLFHKACKYAAGSTPYCTLLAPLCVSFCPPAWTANTLFTADGLTSSTTPIHSWSLFPFFCFSVCHRSIPLFGCQLATTRSCNRLQYTQWTAGCQVFSFIYFYKTGCLWLTAACSQRSLHDRSCICMGDAE